MKLKNLHGISQNTDLRDFDTSLFLTPEQRHAARNEGRALAEKRALIARGIAPMQIGTAWVPDTVARQFAYLPVGGVAGTRVSSILKSR